MTEQYKWEVKTNDSTLLLLLIEKDTNEVGTYQYRLTKNQGPEASFGHTKGTDSQRDELIARVPESCYEQIEAMLRD